ncbi:MAG: FIG022199: FAD-binding protein, partial [uncultured Lysobacter sp.]
GSHLCFCGRGPGRRLRALPRADRNRRAGDRRRPGRQHRGHAARARRLAGDDAGKSRAPALSHRRIAVADEHADPRAPRRARARARDRRAQARRGFPGRRRALQHVPVQARTRRALRPCIPGQARGVRPAFVRTRARDGRRCARARARGAHRFRRRAAPAHRACARAGRRRARVRAALCGRCERPRHRHRQPAQVQAAQHEAPVRRGVQPFHRRRTTTGRQRRQRHDHPPAARLDLDDPAARRRHQRRRRVLARIPQAAPRRHRGVPHAHAARRAGRRRTHAGGRALRPGARHRQLRLRMHAHERAGLDAGGRCVGVRRSDVFFGRVPGDEQRRARRRCDRCGIARAGARTRADGAARTPPHARAGRVQVVHLPLHHAGDEAPVREPAQLLAGRAGGRGDAGRRRVRQPRRAPAPARVPRDLYVERAAPCAAGTGRLAPSPTPGARGLCRGHIAAGHEPQRGARM